MEMMVHMYKGDIIRTSDSTPSYKKKELNEEIPCYFFFSFFLSFFFFFFDN